jgi:hypothetical protein
MAPVVATAGAAALVLLVAGLLGALGGGGPDLEAPDEAGPQAVDVIPEVVGMTLLEATDTLEEAGYQASPNDSDDPYTEVCDQDPEGATIAEPGSPVSLRTAAAIWCDALLDPSISPNEGFETYTDEMGRTWYATSCPSADVLLRASGEHADALPEHGATDYVSADDALISFQESAESLGVVSSSVGLRHGDVWYEDDDGEIRIRWFRDYLIQAFIDDPGDCPSAAYFWDGVPVAFILGDTG